ncbi:hypothetical protein K458DRAFT_399772 [Lentithecium fluviatile CBS 122367]|uniref:Uncharacterized protein n=1 Tax=Lentithecium fluviatile CBS 122367 TaxID=1168545 RepID=A0A6G1JJZ4_9PLEO|nr:hypothetical protein K458DRAFT_399772 [Lentithecium fluviatile CBS 122367]
MKLATLSTVAALATTALAAPAPPVRTETHYKTYYETRYIEVGTASTLTKSMCIATSTRILTTTVGLAARNTEAAATTTIPAFTATAGVTNKAKHTATAIPMRFLTMVAERDDVKCSSGPDPVCRDAMEKIDQEMYDGCWGC